MTTSIDDLVPQGGSEHSRVEVVAARLLGLAAVAIAFSSCQSALWGGVQDEALTDSVLKSNEGVDALQLGDTMLSSDQALWTAMLTSGPCGGLSDLLGLDLDAEAFEDLTPCGQIVLGLSDGAWKRYETGRPTRSCIRSTGTATTCSSMETARSSRKLQESRSQRHRWTNKNGDGYELASTFLTIALFFAGISFVLASTRIRWVLIAGSAVVLVGSTGYLLSLPKTF